VAESSYTFKVGDLVERTSSGLSSVGYRTTIFEYNGSLGITHESGTRDGFHPQLWKLVHCEKKKNGFSKFISEKGL
jgi:hypothetical protein